MGGRAGVGGEDGCSSDRTVSPAGGERIVRNMDFGPRSFLSMPFLSAPFLRALLMGILVAGLAGCTHQSAAAQPDDATRLQMIPEADATKYPPLQEGKHWGNPYLVIRPDKVGLLSDVAANEEQMLKPEEVLKTLAQLPAQAWPYGRAVAILVDDKSAISEQDKAALRRNRGIVEGDLEMAHVAIRWISNS